MHSGETIVSGGETHKPLTLADLAALAREVEQFLEKWLQIVRHIRIALRVLADMEDALDPSEGTNES